MKKRKVDFLNNLGKNLERRWKPRFLDNFYFNKCLNLTAYLVFTLVVVVLIKTIISQFIPAKPSPPIISRGNVMLIEYMGLPFAFWFFISLGLVLGLTFHGFKLFSINIERKK